MSAARSTSVSAAKLLVELGPVVAWIIAYNLGRRIVGEDAIYWATGVYMTGAIAAFAYVRLVQKRTPLMLVFATVIVVFFGVLTIILQSKTFAYIKPTIINSFYTVLILASLAMGRNIWKVFFGELFRLPDRVWTILALRWAGFFAFLAVLNEILWRAPPDAFWLQWTGMDAESFWANFKLFGNFPLVLLFGALNTPLALKHHVEPDEPAEAAE